MGTPTGGEPRQPERPSSRLSHIRVTSPVNAALRQMRADAPRTAQMIDELIRNIPNVRSEPVRIVVPETQQEQEERVYRAGLPPSYDAPVVIYRELRPDEGPGGDWLVTALISREEYEEYRRAESSGILDDPAVRSSSARLGGTVATIFDPEPGGTRYGGGNR